MSNEKYYVPHGTYWPIIGSIGISTLFVGFANQMHDVSWGWPVMVLGFAIIAFMMFGWLGTVVNESVGGIYNAQVDKSFRWGMSWFIFSEVMFFAAFFGALLYARVLSVPWLGGADNNIFTPELWEGFKATWPLISTPSEVGQNGVTWSTNFKLVDTWGLPEVRRRAVLIAGRPHVSTSLKLVDQVTPFCPTSLGVEIKGQVALNPSQSSGVKILLSAPPSQGTLRTLAYNRAPKNAAKNITSEKMNQLMPHLKDLSTCAL
jgi:hypothetical protein